MAVLDIPTPRVFAPLLQPARYKGVYGGRGSGKSDFLASMAVERCIMQPGTRVVCIREIQKSIDESVKAEIVDKINRFEVGHMFRVLDTKIKTPGGGLIIFNGMQDHTAHSIKSLANFDIALVEEAQALSKNSLRMLTPTIRKPGSELWFAWNPQHPEDPVDDFFRGPKADPEDPDIICVRANWSDNPYFPDGLERDRLRDLRDRPDEYDHIWEGGYQRIAAAQIFRGKFVVEDFETPESARFYFGADFGFSQDPSVLIRCFIIDHELYIDYEAGGVGIELDEMAQLYDSIPGSRLWPIKADNSRPETISHIKRKGYNISPADKWQGSVADGIAFLKSFKRIVVHTRCQQTAREMRLYSYKVDKHTGDVLPIIVDADNHYIDALRYAMDGLVRGKGPITITTDDVNRFAGPRRR